MKIKIDFVTNSSSSSFIIAKKTEKSLYLNDDVLAIFEKYPALELAFEGYSKAISNLLDERVITNEDEMWEFLDNSYGIEKGDADCEEPYWKNRIDKMKEYLSKGFFIYEKEVDNNDESVFNMIHKLESENFVIIMGEN